MKVGNKCTISCKDSSKLIYQGKEGTILYIDKLVTVGFKADGIERFYKDEIILKKY